MDKRAICFIFIISVLFLCSSCGHMLQPKVNVELHELKPGNYQLDPRHATVLFKVSHLGLSDYVGRFNRFDASLQFDPADIASSKLEALIHMDSVDVNNPDFEDTLKGRSWLNVAQYPQAVFKTTSAQRRSGSSVRFNGDLTFLGKSAPVVLDVTFNGGAENMLTGRYTIGFDATMRFKRSDYGLDKYIPAVGDDIDINVYAEFQKF